MPDENTTTPTSTTPVNGTSQIVDDAIPQSSNVVEPVLPDSPSKTAADSAPNSDIISKVVSKMNESQNILIALSSDPSVDELSAAIGLSLFLDKLGKRATAIYSGATPNALEFLKPEETFEPTVDTLQDFVVALNKEKADHLRYKLDGDYVKIYITPYHAKITEEDLEFSYGDFNVDLVLALDVANGVDLDSALREHGRIMHDASIINITTGNPGKLGEIEWSDKSASSVSEMIAKLLYNIGGKTKIEKEEATAFLTGIVAATNRFSNANTTPETMKISSSLMESGANQQLVSKNITPDLENEMFTLTDSSKAKKPKNNDPTKLDVEHEEEQKEDKSSKKDQAPQSETSETSEAPNTTETSKEVEATITEKEHTLLDDLKAAEASLAQAGAETTPEVTNEPLKIDTTPNDSNEPPKIDTIASDFSEPQKIDIAPEPMANPAKTDTILEPLSSNFQTGSNPAVANTPFAPTTPEINGVPEINYNMPMPGEEVLPPPPTPPVDFSSPTMQPIEPATPITEPTPAPTPLGSQPSMQDQVYNPQASDPGAFKIPGM